MVDEKERLERIVRTRATTKRARSYGIEIALIVCLGFLLGVFLAVFRDSFGPALFLPIALPACFLIIYGIYCRWSEKRDRKRHWEIESQLDDQRRIDTQRRISEAKAATVFDRREKK